MVYVYGCERVSMSEGNIVGHSPHGCCGSGKHERVEVERQLSTQEHRWEWLSEYWPLCLQDIK